EAVHWSLRWDGARCEVRDLGAPNGTWLAGLRVDREEARSGDWVRAGSTDFAIYFESTRTPDLNGRKREALDALRSIADQERLYAIVDASRSERILPLLR